MTAKARAFWAVMASLAGHASLLGTLALRAAPTPTRLSTASPDVWTGDSIDVERFVDTADPPVANEPQVAEPGAPAPAVKVPTIVDANALERSRAAPRVPVAANTPVRVRSAPHAAPGAERAVTPDPDDALARKILEYRPAVMTRAAREPSNEGAPSAAARAGGTSDPGPARGFARAFTRAIPAASSGDPAWDGLALGAAGFFFVRVVLGEDGAIAEERVYGRTPRLPSHLERLAERTLALVRGGRFVLTGARAGTETLRIDVTISLRDSEPLVLAFEAPTRGKPGRAYFQLASRRVVEAKVAVE